MAQKIRPQPELPKIEILEVQRHKRLMEEMVVAATLCDAPVRRLLENVTEPNDRTFVEMFLVRAYELDRGDPKFTNLTNVSTAFLRISEDKKTFRQRLSQVIQLAVLDPDIVKKIKP